EDAENNFSPLLRQLLYELWQEWQAIEAQIQQLNHQITLIARQDEACQRLLEIPGVGVLVATALVAAIGNGSTFRQGRDFAAWLGLVPRQHSTGDNTRLLGISKRGNPYLRRLFVHGARSAILHVDREQHTFGEWINK